MQDPSLVKTKSTVHGILSLYKQIIKTTVRLYGSIEVINLVNRAPVLPIFYCD